MKLELAITGTRPLLTNNGRLANPVDPYARKMKELTSKRKKTDEDLLLIMQIEARGGCYETADGLLAWPNENVWRSLYTGATAFKLGESLKRALRMEFDNVPLLVDGQEIAADTFIETAGNIDYRPVKVGKARVMRSRPIVRNWSCHHVFDLDEAALDPRDLLPVIERAGTYVGMGNWRPTFGTFTGEVA